LQRLQLAGAREKPSQYLECHALDVMFIAAHPPRQHRLSGVLLPEQLMRGDHTSTIIKAVISAHPITNALMSAGA
jgi:hypothetical protein